MSVKALIWGIAAFGLAFLITQNISIAIAIGTAELSLAFALRRYRRHESV